MLDYDFNKKITFSVISGRTGSGKSFLIKDILFHMNSAKCFDYIMVISGTSFDDFHYIDRKFVHDASKADTIVRKLLDVSKKFKEKGFNRKWLLVLDDIAGIHFGTDTFKTLFNNYRHHNIHILLATQKITLVPVDVRSNANLTFIFKQIQKTAKDAIEESFNIFETKDEFFNNVKVACSEPYRMMVVNLDDEKYFYYKAIEHTFKIKNEPPKSQKKLYGGLVDQYRMKLF